MRVAGVIAEYNPFHNGHLLHLTETRRRTGCDYLVVVMAGCFTQRGEPALQDKWARTRAALMGGADLVLELPALFAVRTAQWFARGGVELLGALGLVDDLSFGCETGDMHQLAALAALLREEPPAFRTLLRRGLAAGMSHPRARGAAAAELLGLPEQAVSAPNTVLALEYLSANMALNRPMRPVAIERRVGYGDMRLGKVASAGAIRAAWARGEAVEQALPGPLEGPLCGPGGLDQALLFALRGMSPERLAEMPEVAEGLERRILAMAQQAGSREELIGLVKCKRYTWARISRTLTQAMLGMDRKLCETYQRPPYARVLGFREGARDLMRAINRVGRVSLTVQAKDLRQDSCFALERRATDLWGLGTDAPLYRQSGRDLTQGLIRL